MSDAHLEQRSPSDFRTPRPHRVTPWWVAALVAIASVVAITAIMLNRSASDRQAAFSEGHAQTATNDASQRAESAAAQANGAANAANASAIHAQSQAALGNQQLEDNSAMQPQTPPGVNSAAPPGVVTSAPPPQN